MPPSPLPRRCAVCHAPAEITRDERRLPCGHYGSLTARGVVIGCVDPAAATNNLLRAMGEPVDARWERVECFEGAERPTLETVSAT